MSLLSDYTSTKHVLDTRKVGATLQVTQNATLHVSEDWILGSLVARLEGVVLSEKLVHDTSIKGVGYSEHPASPWQFFKQRHESSWWLGWLVERRPVRTERHRVEVKAEFTRWAHYPHAKVNIPELGRPVIFEELNWR